MVILAVEVKLILGRVVWYDEHEKVVLPQGGNPFSNRGVVLADSVEIAAKKLGLRLHEPQRELYAGPKQIWLPYYLGDWEKILPLFQSGEIKAAYVLTEQQELFPEDLNPFEDSWDRFVRSQHETEMQEARFNNP